jgi:FixJ family two-component response regulator
LRAGDQPPSIRVGEIVGEESHPLWIIQNSPDLPIDIACSAPPALGPPLRRPYTGRSWNTGAFHGLAARERMSGVASILIVGIEASLYRTLAATLHAKGFECEVATSSEDGKRKLESDAHEVVVVSLEVPGGSDLLRARRGDGLPLSVIAMTGRPTVRSAVQAFRAGAVDYLAKPIQREELLTAVERAVEKTRALRALRGVDQLVGACIRWFRDAQVLLAVPGAWTLPSAIRDALTERRETAALDQVLIRCLGAQEFGALTRREREVLLAFAQGQRGRDLARCLRISVNTSRSHIKAVLKKLGCHSQRELLDRLGGSSRGGD